MYLIGSGLFLELCDAKVLPSHFGAVAGAGGSGCCVVSGAMHNVSDAPLDLQCVEDGLRGMQDGAWRGLRYGA